MFSPIANASYVKYSEAVSGIPGYSNPNHGPNNAPYKGISFFITLYDNSGSVIHGVNTQIFITISYPNVQEGDQLYFYDTDNNSWIDAANTCSSPFSSANTINDTLTVEICHLTQFAVYGAVPVSSPASVSGSTNTGFLITVIVVPIVVVGIVIGLIAGILLRNTSKGEHSLELGNIPKNSTQNITTSLTNKKTEESSEEEEDTSDEEDTSEEESESNEEKKESSSSSSSSSSSNSGNQQKDQSSESDDSSD